MTKLSLFSTIMAAGLFVLSSSFSAIIPAYTFILGLAAIVFAVIAGASFKRPG